MKLSRHQLWILFSSLLLPVGVVDADTQSQTEAAIAVMADTAKGAEPDRRPVQFEKECLDGLDNDADSVPDCADSDCKNHPGCQPDGKPENSDARCSDWIDNDRDGAMDCDDVDCAGPGILICQGSWKGPLSVTSEAPVATSGVEIAVANDSGLGVEDLIGKGNDRDGERSDELCSDGLDNDGDGMVDCADPGCRFDPTVAICHGTPGLRFSIVAGIAHSYDFVQRQENLESEASGSLVRVSPWDTGFKRLQVRTFGPIPRIQNSFFLLSLRLEKTPRLTFAMFQVPLGGGHYLNVNSGSGGLSNALVESVSKQLLIEPPYYVYSAFEQGNGAALELGGPLGNFGKLQYRTFAAGGTGRFAGNVGGGYVSDDAFNYSYSVGAQLGVSIIGYASRSDNNFIYTSSGKSLGIYIGGKYDQRSLERYPAFNFRPVLRYNRLVLVAESYTKRELEFKSWQTGYVFQVGFLAVPKKLMFAADFGEFVATEMKNPGEGASEVKLGDQRQWRLGAHYYFYRNVGVLSLIYTNAWEEGFNGDGGSDRAFDNLTNTLSLEAQYRF